jgi:predicted  nucleic acid-binding Zn-ribbon protein
MSDNVDTSDFIDEAIARLERYLPIEAEYDRYHQQRHTLNAELKATQAQVEANHQAIAAHDLNIAELKRQTARAEDELGVVQRDLGRAREDYEALVKRLNDIRRRNPL